jgi:glycosyltransferase involved in cell wall biosynthesis
MIASNDRHPMRMPARPAAPGQRPVLTIFFQFDPWGSGMGGIQTLIRSYVKYAPEAFRLRIVGVGGPAQTPGRWITSRLGGREIEFMPMFLERDGNIKPRIPNALRYTCALASHDFSSDFMHFHRIEPALVAGRWRGEKTLFFHIDIEKQLYEEGGRNEFLWRRFPRAYLAFERRMIGRFDRILECNAASLAFHRGRYPELAHRISFTRNCVDDDTYFALDLQRRDEARRQLAQQLGLGPTTRFILFAGRLQPMKDPLLLLRAFAQLDRGEAHLLVAGEGNLREAMEAEIVRLRLQPRVSLLGAQGQDSLVRLQQAASVFALTSAFEGLPLVVLEALACGTPVVTTRAGETPSVLTSRSGLVSDERTPQAVASCLRSVLDRPERFPVSECVAAARPYAAGTVLSATFDQMLGRWQAGHHLAVASAS